MQQQSYTPPTNILEKYAELIVRFGLQRPNGTPLPKGSLVQVIAPEVAKPLLFALQNALLKNGHHPLIDFKPSSEPGMLFEREFYQNANNVQTAYLPEKILKTITAEIDGVIRIEAATEIHSLDTIKGQKIMARSKAMTPIKELKMKRIDRGELSWTIVMYGTDDQAKEAGLTGKQLWQEIIEACYLDHDDPVKEWRRIDKTVTTTADKLSKLDIKSLHWQGDDMNITVGIGKDRIWRAGGGNNIPSYEVFTSPNMHEAEGWIRFSEPHFMYGKRIEGIELWFKDGKVVKSKATKNYDLLKTMLKTPGGNQLGEISLTDSRLSRITKPTGEILYDENMGGTYGNTHMAIGSSFHECYAGKGTKLNKAAWHKLGFNDSVVHSDFVSTTDRTVTATLYDGTEKVIYKDGKFTV